MRTLLKIITILSLLSAFIILTDIDVYATDLTDPTVIPVIPTPDLTAAVSEIPQVPATAELTVAGAAPNTGMTYIDVSIDNQMLSYYVNGVPVLVTPCVTGSPGRGTPRGVFSINSCVPGKYLNGPSWHVWVDRWMRFCGNCGIHDAKWRKSFGGNIYKTNGSHGCVNIPHDQAVQLYSMVGIGTPVIVH